MTLQPFMRLSWLKIHLSLMLFSVLLSGCTAAPVKTTTFDGEWTFEQCPASIPPKACLSEEDVAKIREILIRCQ